jgi:hypothetical protein
MARSATTSSYDEVTVDQSEWFAVEPRKDCPHIHEVASVLDFESKLHSCRAHRAPHLVSTTVYSHPAMSRLWAYWRELGVLSMLASWL